MIDIAYENAVQFDMLDKTLNGRELLESKVSKTIGAGNNKEFENVIKLYFDLDNLEHRIIYFEVEKYVKDNFLSNKKYLLLQPPRGNSAYTYPTSMNINYFIGFNYKLNKKTIKPKRLEVIQNSKNSIYYIYEKEKIGNELNNILGEILYRFYRYRLLDKEVYLTLCCHFQNDITNEILNLKSFLKKYQNQNIFTIGYILNKTKHLLCENQEYVNYQIEKQKESSDDSKLKVVGVCDFCKQTKKLIDNFGAKPYPLKHLKNFTSTMPSVFYANNKATLQKTIRCCVECFAKIDKVDYSLSTFHIGTLREECVNCRDKQFYSVYAYIDVPCKQEIEYQDIKSAMKYLFGDKEALATIQRTIKNEEIFDEDWKVILNIFIVNRGSKQEKNETILNLRNINPHLFNKYNQIFSYINDLNEELTHRTWKGNFSDIFSTISKADKRVSFEVFEAFLNEKDLNVEGLIKRFLLLLKRKFLTSEAKKIEDPYKTHYKYLLLDINNILIIDNLRKKEDILKFELLDMITGYSRIEDKKTVYHKRDTNEIVKALGFTWSELEVGLFDLGMIVQETVSEIENAKDTKIEKVFMRKMNFTGMRNDEVMSYIGYLEDKFQDYKNFIYRLDNKRERLSHLGVALNQEETDISPEKSAYLIAFGYELSTTISNKIGSIINKEKKEKNTDGNQ